MIRFDSRLRLSSLLVWIKVRRSSTSIFPLYCEDLSDTLIEWKIRQLFDILVIVRLALCADSGATFHQQSTMSHVSSPLSDINNLQVVIKYDELHSSRSDFTETLFSVLCLSDHHHTSLTISLCSGSVMQCLFDPPLTQ